MSSPARDALPLALTVPEAAHLLEISTPTAYRLIAQDRFPVRVVKVGSQLRVPRVALEEWLAGEQASA